MTPIARSSSGASSAARAASAAGEPRSGTTQRASPVSCSARSTLPGSDGLTRMRAAGSPQSCAAGHRAGVRGEPHEHRVVAVALAGELAEVELPRRAELGGARVAEVGVVRPHHHLARAPLRRRWATSASSVSAMCVSRRFQLALRPRNIAR
jgi:hypothetical protein